MDDLLRSILGVKRNDKFLAYIVERIRRDDYRGTHKSQHNRYDLDKFEKILRAIYEVVGENSFSVPGGDSGGVKEKSPTVKNQHPDFHEIYQKLKSKGVLDKPDPLRKNFFVEFSRMGFIEKYGSNGNLLDPFGRTYTKTVKLSKEGIRFLNAKTLFEKHKIFTDGVERLLGNTLIDLISAIDLSQYRRDKFSFEEYTLIFSDDRIDGTEKIEILDAWRSLTKNQRDKVLGLIQKYCDPKRFSENKTAKRDYHNWKNETQQLMALFKMTIYFQVYDNQFSLNTGDKFGIFQPTRSEGPKRKYFKEHKIQKQKNYELHHIVPLSYIRNKEEYSLIDNFKNLIYLHKEKHKEIKKDYIFFIPKDPKIHFGNRLNTNDVVTAKRGKNTDFDPSLLSKIKKYNRKLIKSIK